METNQQSLLLDLLEKQRVAALSVVIDDRPYVGLVPFALTRDRTAALIHTSQLARHSAGLATGAPFSLLIHQPDDSAETNPSQLARVTLEGRVRSLDRDDEVYRETKEIYLAKFPKSQITFTLADFTLQMLVIEQARFVAGFGQTYDLTAEELNALD